MRLVLHLGIVLVLTVLTQVGGIAWLLAMRARRVGLAFVLGYAAIWGAVQAAAPLAGRVAVPCVGDVLRMQSPLYCLLMRNFVTPPVLAIAQDAADRVAVAYPGTATLTLDGGFPFLTGFPVLPHLSHDDGEKLDLAFYYADAGGYVVGRTASPLGYFAFERAGPEPCPPSRLTLRWDMAWFQPLIRPLALEPARTQALISALLADARVGKVFVEPPLAAMLGVSGPRLRFQGCRAARHDDHIHVQL